nr:hypothetical protein [Tanacetum cinerariifolium]
EYRHFAKECQKPKRVKDSAYHKEKMLLCKQAEKGVPLQAEQYDWLADTDEEVDEQELEAHYSYMAKIQEVPTADSSIDLEPVEQNEQNNVESNDERVALANLKLDVDENQKIQKKLKKANTTLAQEQKECKAILAETSKSMGESISVRDSFLFVLQTNKNEFEKYKAFNDRTIDYDKLEQPENSLSMGYEHLSITPETEVTESNAKNLLPISSECEVTLEDKRECDELVCKIPSTIDVCDNPSEILFDSNNDDLSSDDESFKDIDDDKSLSEEVSIEEFKVYSNPLFADDEINSDKLDP